MLNVRIKSRTIRLPLSLLLITACCMVLLDGALHAGFGQTSAAASQEAILKTPPGTFERFVEGQPPQEFIVLYDDSQIEAEAESMRQSSGLLYDDDAITEFKASAFANLKHRVHGLLATEDLEVLQDYSHLPMAFVRFWTPQALLHLLERSEVVAVYENRTIYYQQVPADLTLINQPQAASLGMTGSGATVAVLDTGVNYTLPAFGSCTAPGTPAGCKVVAALDANLSNPSGTPLDTNGHGTNVAGIVLEVAPGAAIADVKVFDANSSATDSDVINGIDWAIANKSAYNIVAINMSLGDGGNYTSVCTNSPYVTPVSNAQAAGIISVAASGNSAYTNGTYINGISSPACTQGVVSVGAVYDANIGGVSYGICSDATTAADQICCFSNSASFLTLLAPGADITAAGITDYGTSQATPHVSGAVAIFRAAFPLETLAQTVARLTGNGQPVTDPRNGATTPLLNLLTAVGIPANDNFANATVLKGLSGSVTGTNANATIQAGEPTTIAGNPGGASVWFSLTPANNMQVSLNTNGSNFNTLLGVYTGNSVSSLTSVASNYTPGGVSSVSFVAQAGVTYYIAIDGYSGAIGLYDLNWTQTAVPVSAPAASQWALLVLFALLLIAGGERLREQCRHSFRTR